MRESSKELAFGKTTIQLSKIKLATKTPTGLVTFSGPVRPASRRIRATLSGGLIDGN